MALKELTGDAKKNTPQRSIPTAPMQPGNLIEAAEGPAPRKASSGKKDISYIDSEIKGFVPQERHFGSRNTASNPAHGSIIRNIASQSSTNSQAGGNTTWEECRHRKNNSGKDYCTEYHSLCAKENCRRARK